MALRSNSDNHRLIYENCFPDQIFCETGEKLASIVDYARSVMGIDKLENSEISPEKSYQKYCESLQTKLGSFEPYCRSINLTTSVKQSKKKIADDMNALLPQKHPDFNVLIDKAADHVQEQLSMEPKSIGEAFVKMAKKELALAEFVVFKVFQNGENLQFIPCLLNVTSEQSEGQVMGGLIYSWSNCKVSMNYQQRTFILNKFAIKQIVQKLANKDYGF